MTQPQTYGDAYYASYRGGPYERTPPWLAQFGKVADRICADIAPHTALDAGCAKGFLVEQLRETHAKTTFDKTIFTCFGKG